jgi:hypothetical protein
MSSPSSSGNFIEIIGEDETFPWQYTSAGGRKFDSKFVLRLVPDDAMTRFRKAATGKPKWKHGQKDVEIDWGKFTALQVDHAIVSWEGVRAKGAATDLPCEFKYKQLLPERIKAEIIRLCAGKEAGLEEDEEDSTEEEPEEASEAQDQGDGGDEDPNP